jgi:hypothetical protein
MGNPPRQDRPVRQEAAEVFREGFRRGIAIAGLLGHGFHDDRL